MVNPESTTESYAFSQLSDHEKPAIIGIAQKILLFGVDFYAPLDKIKPTQLLDNAPRPVRSQQTTTGRQAFTTAPPHFRRLANHDPYFHYDWNPPQRGSRQPRVPMFATVLPGNASSPNRKGFVHLSTKSPAHELIAARPVLPESMGATHDTNSSPRLPANIHVGDRAARVSDFPELVGSHPSRRAIFRRLQNERLMAVGYRAGRIWHPWGPGFAATAERENYPTSHSPTGNYLQTFALLPENSAARLLELAQTNLNAVRALGEWAVLQQLGIRPEVWYNGIETNGGQLPPIQPPWQSWDEQGFGYHFSSIGFSGTQTECTHTQPISTRITAQFPLQKPKS